MISAEQLLRKAKMGGKRTLAADAETYLQFLRLAHLQFEPKNYITVNRYAEKNKCLSKNDGICIFGLE